MPEGKKTKQKEKKKSGQPESNQWPRDVYNLLQSPALPAELWPDRLKSSDNQPKRETF